MTENEQNKKHEYTDVLIDGRHYRLMGADSQYIHKVVDFLNSKLDEVRKSQSYINMDDKYRTLMMYLNLSDEYFKMRSSVDKLKESFDLKEKENYSLKHENVSLKLKLENALKQQEILERRESDWKKKYDESKKDRSFG